MASGVGVGVAAAPTVKEAVWDKPEEGQFNSPSGLPEQAQTIQEYVWVAIKSEEASP